MQPHLAWLPGLRAAARKAPPHPRPTSSFALTAAGPVLWTAARGGSQGSAAAAAVAQLLPRGLPRSLIRDGATKAGALATCVSGWGGCRSAAWGTPLAQRVPLLTSGGMQEKPEQHAHIPTTPLQGSCRFLLCRKGPVGPPPPSPATTHKGPGHGGAEAHLQALGAWHGAGDRLGGGQRAQLAKVLVAWW